jgi:hypothetical protein
VFGPRWGVHQCGLDPVQRTAFIRRSWRCSSVRMEESDSMEIILASLRAFIRPPSTGHSLSAHPAQCGGPIDWAHHLSSAVAMAVRVVYPIRLPYLGLSASTVGFPQC